jgi:hypothetical protein
VNGRAVSWLIQVEGSLAGSDSRSQSSLNLNELNSRPSTAANILETNSQITDNQQFHSMQSVSSAGSSTSNNENLDRNNINRHSAKQAGQQQIYDTLNNRKSNKLRPLK